MGWGTQRRYGSNWGKWAYAALFALGAVGCGDNDPAREADVSEVVRRDKPPRPRAPLSGSMSGSRQPVFVFDGGPWARVEICADRPCAHVLASLAGGSGQAQPETPLPVGTVFWRVVSKHEKSAVWQLVIPARETGLPTVFGVVPDYNGDGIADIAIGAPDTPMGSVPIVFGRFFQPGATPDVTLMGGDRFGSAVAAAGDVNGDGIVDLAVASGGDPGSVAIHTGGPDGLGRGVALPAGAISSGFGTTMASAGDVNGDGYGDVVVGGLQAAQVFFGGPGGLAARPPLTLPGVGDGLLVQGPADVNGDDAPDILVGGILYLGTGAGFVPQPGFTPGTIASFAGDVDGDGMTDVAAALVVTGTPRGIDPDHGVFGQQDHFLFETAGDVDGDGYFDVVASLGPAVGAEERERVYFGAPTACRDPGCRPFSPIDITAHDHRGGALRAIIAAAGDVNGDGGDDLVVATPENGTVFVYLAGGARELPLTFLVPALSGGAGFGSSLAGLFGTAPTAP
jgi:hypothetical protein